MERNKVLYRFTGWVGWFLLFFPAFSCSANAIEIKSVHSSKGVHAWLVEDHTVPVIAIQFSFRGGSVQDPVGKEGLTNLMSTLFDEGAGDISSDAFQAYLDDLGGDMSFSANRDSIRGSLRVLAENRDQAVKLLALAVQKPRFDQDAVDRIREQLIAGIRASERDPSTIAQKKFAAMVYGKHPYGRWGKGSSESLEKITRDDLVLTHARMFARDNVKIGIVGPISPEEAGRIVEQVFDILPKKAQLQLIESAKLHLGGMITVNYNLPQTSITLLYPGIKRDDPEFFAAYLMNYTLGGPGLTSRLFAEVREKRGFAYNISSRLMNFDYASALAISTGTRADSAQKSLEIIREEARRMAAAGMTADELVIAKSYAIGSYAIQNMGSSSDIASTLVDLQEQNLPIDYIGKRIDLINAVTRDAVNAVARKLLSIDPSILMVGRVKD
ncbi:MAG: zinc protease [Candidatus Tokpelaia sp. JSC189]|nr:MAG: zinc protease [Candidatus Tokpelaia sp. JSC189]